MLLGLYGAVLGLCVWLLVLGFVAMVEHSVIGGLAVVVIATLLFSAAAWRFGVKLRQVRSR